MVLIPKVVAEVALLVGKTNSTILNLLKRLFTAIREMGVLTKQMSGLLQEISHANRNVLRLEVSRLEAVDTAGHGWSGVKSAYNLLSDGHVRAYGTVDKVAVETARSASQTNGVQNAGSTGSIQTNGQRAEPNPIELPL